MDVHKFYTMLQKLITTQVHRLEIKGQDFKQNTTKIECQLFK